VGKQPEGPPPPPTVQRLRIRYAKRGRLRFTSHRDFARAFERALRRARVPMAYSAGFTPHPKVSYANAAPTGVASEAEYLEIGLAEVRDPDELKAALDAALPEGLDILDVVEAVPGALADRLEASAWQIELPGVAEAEASAALEAFLAAEVVEVTRTTKNGPRTSWRPGSRLRRRLPSGVSGRTGPPVRYSTWSYGKSRPP
jgi:radical SAM-linked protein